MASAAKAASDLLRMRGFAGNDPPQRKLPTKRKCFAEALALLAVTAANEEGLACRGPGVCLQ
eukprot:8595930-Pyramimonas_sp.AAC.1